LRAVASVAAGVTWMRLEGADLLDHRLPQSLLGQCTGPRREGVVAQDVVQPISERGRNTHGRRAGDLPRCKREARPDTTRGSSSRGPRAGPAPGSQSRGDGKNADRQDDTIETCPAAAVVRLPARDAGVHQLVRGGDPAIDARSPQCGLTQLVEAVPPRGAFMFAENRR
jgi:hypothetical protein